MPASLMPAWRARLWLLALSLPTAVFAADGNWQSFPGGRSAPLPEPAGREAGCTLMPAAQTGVGFTNHLSFQKRSLNHNLMNGAGVAAGDFDGDGLCDLYFCNLEGPGALLKNLGNWKFHDVTASAGVACPNQSSTGAVFADVNGDSRPDLLVNSCGGPNALFLNLGGGRFTNMTAAAGLLSKAGSTSLALADVDGDGDLDLYVANYGENTIRSGLALSTRMVNGREVVTGRYANRVRIIDGKIIEFGEPGVLYLNDGQGHFAPVSWTGGTFLDPEGRPLTAVPWDMGLSAMFRDFNGDGWPDLYTCNDFQTPDRFWINDGKGHFRIAPTEMLPSMSHFSMTVDAADINGDGRPDFLVADMKRRSHQEQMRQSLPDSIPVVAGEFETRPQIRRNTLFVNRGDQTFQEIANFAGLSASDWTWSVVFLDVDLDGFSDVLVSNGHAYDTEDLDTINRVKTLGRQTPQASRTNLMLYPPLNPAKAAFRNRGDLTFEEMGDQWGFNARAVGHGMALADLDHDGDLDVVVNCLNASPLLYRNDTAKPRVAVRLRGLPPNTQAIGATLRLRASGLPLQSQEVISGGRYLSGDDPLRVFAAHSTNMTLEVSWRGGRFSRVDSVLPNRLYELFEEGATNSPPAVPPSPPAWFEEVVLPHRHHEEPFDDFARQPLLPRKLSQAGPGLAWCDLDGDGVEELAVGSGKGGKLALLTPKEGRWTLVEENQALSDDLTGLALSSSPEGKPRLLAGLSRYEQPATNTPASLLEYAWNGTNLVRRTVQDLPDPGPVALADLEGDGDLDLFTGGTAIPGLYPESPPSRLYRNEGGQWKLDEASSKVLASARRVNGAVWSDLDQDGLPELIVACAWGPVRVYSWKGGTCRELTQSLGLDRFTGLWQGVTAGDFNGDGRMDVAAANWGLNSDYGRHEWELYYGDWDHDGAMEMVQAFHDPESGKLVPDRNLLLVPAVSWMFSGKTWTHLAYGQASLAEILGPHFQESGKLAVNTLSSMVWLNLTNGWKALPLPQEAQFSPVFAINVADFDGDGREDLFLSQNFFATPPETPRSDAGRGLVLRGDGKGGFESQLLSGIKVYGEQRGAALGDYDQDGRVDVAVSQNGGMTRLFHNTRAKPGLRVRLQGPAGNPLGMGAQLRIRSEAGWGPVREVHSSAGYWSADSSIPVLALPPQPIELQVRWPGGKTSSTPIKDGDREVMVRAP